MRDVMRSPVIPLDFDRAVEGKCRELLIDYDRGEIYVVSPTDPNKLINITKKATETAISYVQNMDRGQMTDISNTYVTIGDLGKFNISSLLAFLMEYGIDGHPADELGPIALRKIAYDNASIVISNNRIGIAGFKEAGADYVPVKTATNTIVWVPLSMLPTPDGYTPNKYDIQDIMPVDGIIQLRDNPPVQRSFDIEGAIEIKLPRELTANYCTLEWITSVVNIPDSSIIFSDNVKWRYQNDAKLKPGDTYIYVFETFDGGDNWYGKRTSYNKFDEGTPVTNELLFSNFYTMQDIDEIVRWKCLDASAEEYINEANFGNIVNLVKDTIEIDDIVKFRFCLSETFYNLDELHMNWLYFLIDTGEMYRGPVSFSRSLVRCRKWPESPTNGKIYFNMNTKELRYYDSLDKEWIPLLTPMVTSLLTEGIDYDKVTANGTAIKEYVDYKIEEVYKSLGKQEGYNTTPIFTTYDAALKYASESTASRAGQCITAPSVLDSTELVMYVIQPDKTLKEYPSMEQIKKLISWKTE